MILAWLSAAFVLGVALGTVMQLPAAVVVPLAAVLTGVAWTKRDARWRTALLLLGALWLGAARAPHAATQVSPHDLAYYNGSRVQVHGTVDAEPDVRDRGINYVVHVDRVLVGARSIPVAGRVEVHTPRAQQLEYADAVMLTGRLIEPLDSRSVPYRQILAQRGIRSQMRFPRIVDLGPTQPRGLGWLVPIRQRLESGIDRWLPEPEAALLIAITLGARSASLGDLAPILVSTGLIHVIAISGIKVALVAGTLYELTRLARRRLMTLVLPLLGLTVYVLLTGSTASGERSAGMWALVFIAAYLGRGTLALVSLSFVAALMVAVDPNLLWDIGFQLSTVGTFAIVAFAGPVGHAVRFVVSPVREAFSVTVAAQLGTLPIVAVGFHLVSVTGPIANALVLPLLPILIALGFLLGACSGAAALAAPLGALTYGLLHAMIAVATWLSRLPGVIPTQVVSPEFAAGYYCLLAAIALLVLRRVEWAPVAEWTSRSREFSLALIMGASILTASSVRAGEEGGTRLYWLGSGDAILLRSHGMTALIDGSPHPFTLLERLDSVLPYSVRTIDLVVVTDPRPNNVVSLEAVLQHYAVSEVLDVGAQYPSTTYAAWRAELRRRRISVYALRAGVSSQVGDARVEAIGPDGLHSNPQDGAGMLRVSAHGHTALLAGNASEREQTEAVFRPVTLRADALVLGGNGRYAPAFLQAVQPKTVLTRGNVPTGVRSIRLHDGSAFSLQL